MLGDDGIRMFAVLLLAISLVWSTGCSESPPADPNAGMRELYDLSDLPRQVQPLAAFIESTLEQQRAQFTSEQFEVAKQVIRTQFNPDDLAGQARDRVEKQPQRDLLGATLESLRSPAVRNVIQAKVTVLRPSRAEEMKAFFEQERASPATQKRRELIERYDRSARASSIAAEIMLLSANCVTVMANALTPPEERLGPAALRKSTIERQKLLEPIFEEMTLVVSLFGFRNISDEELESFVTFSESEAGKWYYEITSAALLGTLRDITANLDTVFIAALPTRPSS
jgi:hypothetical protein